MIIITRVSNAIVNFSKILLPFAILVYTVIPVIFLVQGKWAEFFAGFSLVIAICSLFSDIDNYPKKIADLKTLKENDFISDKKYEEEMLNLKQTYKKKH